MSSSLIWGEGKTIIFDFVNIYPLKKDCLNLVEIASQFLPSMGAAQKIFKKYIDKCK